MNLQRMGASSNYTVSRYPILHTQVPCQYVNDSWCILQDQTTPFDGQTTPLTLPSANSTDLVLGDRCLGHLIGNLNSDVHCMPHLQGVAWQRNERQPYYFAVGQGSGKVLLAK